MYPPLDPRLLEARAAAMSLAVTHLVLITRYECGQKGKSVDWINRSLAEMDSHMLVSNHLVIVLWTYLNEEFLGSTRSSTSTGGSHQDTKCHGGYFLKFKTARILGTINMLSSFYLSVEASNIIYCLI